MDETEDRPHACVHVNHTTSWDSNRFVISHACSTVTLRKKKKKRHSFLCRPVTGLLSLDSETQVPRCLNLKSIKDTKHTRLGCRLTKCYSHSKVVADAMSRSVRNSHVLLAAHSTNLTSGGPQFCLSLFCSVS